MHVCVRVRVCVCVLMLVRLFVSVRMSECMPEGASTQASERVSECKNSTPGRPAQKGMQTGRTGSLSE